MFTTQTLMIFQAIISVLLVIIILMQFGKGAEAGFLGGASESVMSGAQKGNILTKITTVLAILFLINSVYLARLQSHSVNNSKLDGIAPQVDQPLVAPNEEAAAPAPTDPAAAPVEEKKEKVK